MIRNHAWRDVGPVAGVAREKVGPFFVSSPGDPQHPLQVSGGPLELAIEALPIDAQYQNS
jgi:hypothetical protein